MKILSNNLITVGTIVMDDELLLYLLSGLGLEYDPVIVNTTTRTTMPTCEKVHLLLLTH